MYIKIEIIVVLALVVTFVLAQNQNIQERFYTQKLDHFSGTPGTWGQRYLINNEFYKPGGSIFLLLGGPDYTPITPKVLQRGSIMQYAKDQGAYLVAIEARYYGQSRPTPDLSTANLRKFHTVAQTIEDLKVFVRALKTQPSFQNSKVVGFGVGFVGSRLINIMRQSPGLIDIAVASSAPVEAKFEIPEFVGKGAEVVKQLNIDCYNTIRSGLQCMTKIFRGETCEGRNITDFPALLNLCDSNTNYNSLDVGGIVSEAVKSIGAVLTLNIPDPRYPYNAQKMCYSLTDPNKGPLEKLTGEIRKISSFRKQTCIESKFEQTVSRLQNTAWDTPASIKGERQTYFFRCNEAALIRGLDKLDVGKMANTLPPIHFLALCKRLFNISEDQIRANTIRTNNLYGNRKLPSRCTIFVSGEEDLFSVSAVKSQQEAGRCNRAITIEGASFARERSDIVPEEKSIPRSLRKGQLLIGQLIGQWLKTGDCCLYNTNTNRRSNIRSY